MDAAALASLLTAFKLAPSADLGRIIVHAQLEQQDLSAATATLEAIALQLPSTELAELLQPFAKAGQLELLNALLTQLSSHPLLEAMSNLDIKLAQQVYRHWIAIQADVSSSFWHNRLGMEVELSRAGAEGKPRLRVVEKTPMTEVTHISDYQEPTVNFADVVGLEDVKEQIHKKIILPFQKPGFFQRFKKKIGGGVLLYGPPGCGKTLIARATAGQCNAHFYNIQAADVLDMYIGESEQKLRAIFAKARAEKPCILFFDELEALAGKREHSRNSSTANVVSQFLTELDGFAQANEGILILASTNVPWAIDSAFLRPGRFDRMFFVPPPDKVARAAILRHQMKDRPQDGDIAYEAIAAKLSGHSGADLTNLVEMAADEAIDESIAKGEDVNIANRHFLQAQKLSRNTTSDWLTTARNYARYANEGGRYNEVLEFLQRHGK